MEYQREFLTDRGKNFIGEVISWIEYRLDIKQMKTSSFHPQTNALTERFNKTMAEMLTMFVETKQKDWDIYLAGVLFAYRTARQSTTEYSPFFLLYGREAREPGQLQELDNINQDRYTVDKYAEQLVQRLQNAFNQVRQKEDKKRKKRNDNLSKNRKDHLFQVDDLVMLYTKSVKKGRSAKLAATWQGPFKILRFATPVTVILSHPGSKKKRQPVHVSRLKFYKQLEHEDIAKDLQQEAVSEDVKDDSQEGHVDSSETEWEIQEITDIKKKKAGIFYRVRWKGFPDSESTWEPVRSLSNAKEAIESFHKKNNMFCTECEFLALTPKGLKTHSKRHQEQFGN